jgi:hypothetical protein
MTGYDSKRKMAADKLQKPYDQTALELCNVCGWKTLIPDDGCLNCERAQPAQEPVAWAVVGDGKFGKYEIGRETLTDIDSANYWISRGYKLVSIYTTPPQRPWVGLTDDALADIWYKESLDWMEFARAHEAALKKKNT